MPTAVPTTEITGAGKLDTTWWKRAVIYQVYPRSFADSNGDGIGDLPGIIDRLDYLHTLGVDAIWLSPFFTSPQADNGYDISDYRDVDPAFGTLADLDRLIEGVHARGMRLVMDLVVNHSSDEHPWFVESASSPDNPKRDWYWWRPPREGFVGGTPGAEPTDWESFFSGPAWTWHEPTGEYYLHLFSTKQPDLNWENEAVRRAVYEMMNWWLDRGVDGFRMDVINMISKELPLRDTAGAAADAPSPFICGPRIHEFLQEMNAAVFGGRTGQFVTVGEMPGVTVEQAELFTDPSRHELDMVFQFEHVGLDHGPGGKWDPKPLELRELKASLARWQKGLARTGWNSLYWNNHDQPRAVSRFGNDDEHWEKSAQALGAVLHLQRGTPYVYQGEELGMTNAPLRDAAEFRDIESINYYAHAVTDLGDDGAAVLDRMRHSARDNARTPMQWRAEPQGGFTTGTPWIDPNPNHATINAATQLGVPGSVFEFYRALIALRHSEPVVVNGDFTMLAPEHPALFAYDRKLDGVTVRVLANLSDDALDVATIEGLELAGWAGAGRLLGNYSDRGGEAGWELRPWEVRVLRRG
ncbi:alpha-glucosidase [Lysinimonas soli]|uniref:Alpha-glucosidase n=1 Tax=Lysinimonas soli TaxID=1074233 RepID=A0ABW0NUV4_9MICO